MDQMLILKAKREADQKRLEMFAEARTRIMWLLWQHDPLAAIDLITGIYGSFDRAVSYVQSLQQKYT